MERPPDCAITRVRATIFATVVPLNSRVMIIFLQCALSLRDQLWFCFIPDGAHVPFFALANYIDLVGLVRTVLVTDAISTATLGPGVHEISGMRVAVDQRGVARISGSKNLAGTTITTSVIINNLTEQLGMTSSDFTMVLDHNPRKAIGRSR